MGATLAADPLTIAALVIVTIESQTIAKAAQGATVFIVAALEASQRVFVRIVLARDNGAQGSEVVVDEDQDVIIAFASVANKLTDFELGQALLEVFEAGEGLEMVVAIGGHEGAGDGPVGEQAIVDDVEALGLVAIVMLAARGCFGFVIGTSVGRQ